MPPCKSSPPPFTISGQSIYPSFQQLFELSKIPHLFYHAPFCSRQPESQPVPSLHQKSNKAQVLASCHVLPVPAILSLVSSSACHNYSKAALLTPILPDCTAAIALTIAPLLHNFFFGIALVMSERCFLVLHPFFPALLLLHSGIVYHPRIHFMSSCSLVGRMRHVLPFCP